MNVYFLCMFLSCFERFENDLEDIEDNVSPCRLSTSTIEKIFNIHGTVYLHWVPEGQNINQHHYFEVLVELTEKILK